MQHDWKTSIEENVCGEKHSYQSQLSHLQGFNRNFITIFTSRGFVYKCTDDNRTEEGAAYVVRAILEKTSFIIILLQCPGCG